MFGIKKDKGEVSSNNIESTPAIELNVATSNAVSTPEVTKEITKSEVNNIIKEKKKNVMWAKILVIAITMFTIFLGLYKFAEFLNTPKTLFYSAIETSYNDFTDMMLELQSHNLLSLISDNGTEISSDIKITTEKLASEYEVYNTILNDLSYTSQIKIDRKNKYLSSELKMSKDGQEKMSFTLIDDNYNTYIEIPEIYREYIELNNSSFNIDAFDAEKNVYLGDIFKSELLKILSDENFESELKSIALNGVAVDCKKNTYTFTGTELKVLIDNIIASVKTNSNAYYYLAELYGVNASELDVKLEELKNSLNIIDSNSYSMSAYTKEENDEAVRLEFEYERVANGVNAMEVIAYNRDLSYRAIDYIQGNNHQIFELKGDLNTSYEILLNDGATTITIEAERLEDKTEGSVRVDDNITRASLMNVDFSYMVVSRSNSAHSVSINMDFTNSQDGKESKLNINSSTLINSGVNVEKIKVNNSTHVDDFTDEEIKLLEDTFNQYISLLDIELKGGGIVVEVPTGGEVDLTTPIVE